MRERQNYNTKPRKYILDFLDNRKDCTVSAADIIAHFESNGVKVNSTTVYRCLNKLSEEKRVLKFTDEETQKSVYRLIATDDSCGEHIHIKCVKCGRLMHLECEFMEDIKRHLSDDHGFSLQCDGSILYGICAECNDKN